MTRKVWEPALLRLKRVHQLGSWASFVPLALIAFMPSGAWGLPERGLTLSMALVGVSHVAIIVTRNLWVRALERKIAALLPAGHRLIYRMNQENDGLWIRTIVVAKPGVKVGIKDRLVWGQRFY